MPEVILQSVSMNDYEKSGSKFAAPGLHLAEFKMAAWSIPVRSFKFPFQIIEGPDSGKEGKITAGANAEGVWKLKEILQSLGVAVSNKNGKVAWNTEDVIGKQAKVLWVTQRDTRTPEEGGKGTTYTKPVSVHPVETTAEDLSI